MENAFGLIYTGDASMQLRELTISRSVAAVPFGGRYRAIDFMLSDLVNTGIYNVGIIAQKNYHSLMDHLESGKEWDLHRKRDGLFVLPPFVTHDNTGAYRGTVDAIRSCLGYVRRSQQRYVVLMGSHTIYNTTFNAMLEQHIKTGADITIMYNEEKPGYDPRGFDADGFARATAGSMPCRLFVRIENGGSRHEKNSQACILHRSRPHPAFRLFGFFWRKVL